MLVFNPLQFFRGQNHPAVCLVVLQSDTGCRELHCPYLNAASVLVIISRGKVPQSDIFQMSAVGSVFDEDKGKELTWGAFCGCTSRGSSSKVFTLGWYSLEGATKTQPAKGTQL